MARQLFFAIELVLVSLSFFSPLVSPLQKAKPRALEQEKPTAVVHLKNIAANDGLGLNCITCVETIARHEGLDLNGLQEWAKRRRGGSWPGKLGADVLEFCKRTQIDPPAIDEVETRSLEPLEKMLERGWVMVSDHGGPTSRYKYEVNTAVILFQLDDCLAAIYDPNWPGEPQWVPRETFARRFVGKEENGWAFQPYKSK
jgi:hypothetical protein